MTDQPVSADLLRGVKEIALEIYGSADKATVRRLYHEQDRWPLFKLDKSGVLYGLRSRIRAHIAAKSAEKEARIAFADTAIQKKTVRPPRKRRRAKRPADTS